MRTGHTWGWTHQRWPLDTSTAVVHPRVSPGHPHSSYRSAVQRVATIAANSANPCSTQLQRQEEGKRNRPDGDKGLAYQTPGIPTGHDLPRRPWHPFPPPTPLTRPCAALEPA